MYLTTLVDSLTPLSKRRDDSASLSSDHKHVTFSDTCPVPSKQRDCLACRKCKRALVLCLGQSFKQLPLDTCRLRELQKVVLAGCFSNLVASLEGDPDLSSVLRDLLPKVLQTFHMYRL